jgi:hypothetical protein
VLGDLHELVVVGGRFERVEGAVVSQIGAVAVNVNVSPTTKVPSAKSVTMPVLGIVMAPSAGTANSSEYVVPLSRLILTAAVSAARSAPARVTRYFTRKSSRAVAVVTVSTAVDVLDEPAATAEHEPAVDDVALTMTSGPPTLPKYSAASAVSLP